MFAAPKELRAAGQSLKDISIPLCLSTFPAFPMICTRIIVM
jgi:hypothetical protein